MACTAEVTSGPFRAGEPCSVELLVRPDGELAPGDALEVQFPNSWLLVSGPSYTRELQTSAPRGEHYVSVSAAGARFETGITRRNLFFPEGGARHGRLINARLVEGSVPAGGELRLGYVNTLAPYVSEREELYVRLKGEAPERAPELVTAPGPAECLRVLAPSGAEPGREFEVLIVSLDRFENRSSTRFEDRKLELVGDGARAEGLSFTGGVRVPVTLEAEGVYRFRVDGVLSNAVRVARGAKGPYWGDIHIHTGLSPDGMGCDPYGYARETSGLDFAGVCDHTEGLGRAGFERILAWAREHYRPGSFVTVLGDERNPREWTGHHNVYFRDEESFLRCQLRPGCFPARSPEGSRESLEQIEARPEDCLLIPHHTGMGWGELPAEGKLGCAVDFSAVEDERGMRPVMEIYSHHGQSEVYAPGHVLAYEFNRMRNPERRSNTSVPGPFYAQDHWAAGRRLGVIGSSDEHSGQGGRRHGGLAAVLAEELTRQGIFEALAARRCYATTGERILLEFTVDGVGMGQEARRRKGARLAVRLAVWGTAELVRVDILRYRFGVDPAFRPIYSQSPRLGADEGARTVAAVGVPAPTTDAAVELEDEFTGPVVYYARVVQEPLAWPGMAWSSPVWISPE